MLLAYYFVFTKITIFFSAVIIIIKDKFNNLSKHLTFFVLLKTLYKSTYYIYIYIILFKYKYIQIFTLSIYYNGITLYVAVYYIARTNFNLQMCNLFCIEKCSVCSINYLSIIIAYKHAFFKKL